MSRLLRGMVALSVLVVVGLGSNAVAAGRSPFAATTAKAAGAPIEAAKSFTARLAQSDPSLLGKTGSNLVRVMVRLDYDPVASYFGGIRGLSATSPEVTKKALSANGAAVAAYRQYLDRQDARIVHDIEVKIPDIQIGRSFHIGFGGIMATLPANRVDDLLAVDGVVAVMKDKIAKPQTNVTPKFLHATAV